jgi:hypothetical protein
MQDEETDLSFADVNTSPAPKRPYTAPLLNDDPDNENAPDQTDRGHSLYLEHETGLAGACRFAKGLACCFMHAARPRSCLPYLRGLESILAPIS